MLQQPYDEGKIKGQLKDAAERLPSAAYDLENLAGVLGHARRVNRLIDGIVGMGPPSENRWS